MHEGFINYWVCSNAGDSLVDKPTMEMDLWIDLVNYFFLPELNYLNLVKKLKIINLIKLKKLLVCSLINKLTYTQECLDEMEWVSSSLTKVLGSNPALGM